MRILDLTLPEASAPGKTIIQHYARFWAGENFVPLPLSEEELTAHRALLLRHLAIAEELLQARQFPIGSVTAALIVGNDSANGHAFLDDNNVIAWFAIESFKSELQAKIFVMHELIHALHYRARPEFAFATVDEKNLLSRQLITEGIATYLTKSLLDVSDEEALWADALPATKLRSWIAACRDATPELCEFTIRHFDSSDPAIELFYASNSQDIFSFRAGYYVGLKVMEAIFREHGFTAGELLRIPFHEMRSLVLEVLREQKFSL